MPDETTEAAPDAAEDTTTADAQPDAAKVPDGARNPDAVQRALDAERKAAKEARKRADELAAKVDEFEQRDKSEIEKAQTQAEKAVKRAQGAEAQLLRYEVAQEKEVPAKLVPLLNATEREALEQQADLILEAAKPSEPQTEFDAGVREPANENKTPEQAHAETLLQVLGIPQNTT